MPKFVPVLGIWTHNLHAFTRCFNCGFCIVVVLFFVHEMRSRPNVFPHFLGKCGKGRFPVP